MHKRFNGLHHHIRQFLAQCVLLDVFCRKVPDSPPFTFFKFCCTKLHAPGAAVFLGSTSALCFIAVCTWNIQSSQSNYIDIPLDVCEKNIEVITSLVKRSNKWIDNRFPNGKNPFVRDLIENGVHTALPCVQQVHENENLRDLCLKLDKLLVASEEDAVQKASISDVAGMASALGLPTIVENKSKSNERRVIRGLEGGDVRFNENAAGNLCI